MSLQIQQYQISFSIRMRRTQHFQAQPGPHGLSQHLSRSLAVPKKGGSLKPNNRSKTNKKGKPSDARQTSPPSKKPSLRQRVSRIQRSVKSLKKAFREHIKNQETSRQLILDEMKIIREEANAARVQQTTFYQNTAALFGQHQQSLNKLEQQGQEANAFKEQQIIFFENTAAIFDQHQQSLDKLEVQGQEANAFKEQQTTFYQNTASIFRQHQQSLSILEEKVQSLNENFQSLSLKFDNASQMQKTHLKELKQEIIQENQSFQTAIVKSIEKTNEKLERVQHRFQIFQRQCKEDFSSSLQLLDELVEANNYQKQQKPRTVFSPALEKLHSRMKSWEAEEKKYREEPAEISYRYIPKRIVQ